MCNAWNHPAGCDCGFGPPYAGEYNVVEAIDWKDEILTDRESLPRRFTPLRLAPGPAATYGRELSRLSTAGEPYAELAARARQLFSQWDLVGQEIEIVQVLVPLFRLHSPQVSGASVRYSEGHEEEAKSGWLVRIPGLGTGKTKTLNVKYRNEYVSAAGECKEVFVPVKIRVFDVTIYENGIVIGQGTSTEAVGRPRDTALRGRGVRSFSATECAKRHPREEGLCEPFLLAGDSGGGSSNFERSWSLNVARIVSLELHALGVGVQPIASIRRTRQIQLSYTLPGGHDYRSWLASGGVYWELDTEVTVDSADRTGNVVAIERR